MKQFLVRYYILLLAGCLSALPSHASITVLNYWRMGEDDSGDTRNGSILFGSGKDSVGANNMTFSGGPFYRTPIAASAATHVGSTIGVDLFTTTVYGKAAQIAMTDNFGVEIWVRPGSVTGTNCIFYNGNPAANGWGIYQNKTSYVAVYGGVTTFGNGTATAGTWTHLALIRQNGVGYLYVDGTLSLTSFSGVNNLTTNQFCVGVSPATFGDNLIGYIDECRVFTFSPGTFTTNDLLINAGAPTAVSSAASGLGTTNVTLNGTVNAHALYTKYYFQYGATTGYGLISTTNIMAPATSALSINTGITNLTPLTQYHYRLIATNSAGTNAGSDLTFTTYGPPTATTQAASAVANYTAKLNASVNPNGYATTYYFIYGTNTSYGRFSSTNSLTASTVATVTNISIYGLDGGTVYHFAIVAANSAGTTTGSDLTFTTTSGYPSVATKPVTQETNTSAMLNGSAYTHGGTTTTWFEWGLGSLYNNTTAPVSIGSGSTPVAISNQLTGLIGGLPYHYRAVASNSFGIVRGWEMRLALPALTLNNANPLTNLINTTYNDPGVTATASPQAIGAGLYYSVVLRADGSPAGWGFVPTGFLATETSVMNLATGSDSMLALRPNGTIAGYGLNNSQLTIPPEATNGVAVAVSGFSSLGLRADGSLAAWGSSGYNSTYISTNATNVVAVGVADSTRYALRADGVLLKWDTVGDAIVASNITAFSANYDFCLAIKSDRTLIAAGDNSAGQLNIPANATNILAVSAGKQFALALRADGVVIGWGANSSGQSNVPATATNIVAIAAGFLHSMAQRADGTLIFWGANSHGEATITSAAYAWNYPVASTNNVITNVAGTYTATYKTTNQRGATFTTTRTIVLNGSPAVAILSATGVTSTNATLNGSINPNGLATTFYFRYGLTTSYDGFTSTNTLVATNISIATNALITGLQPGKTYHYQLVASNSAGVTLSADQTFITLAQPPTVTILNPITNSYNSALLSALISSNGAPTGAYFRYGLTTSYGSNTIAAPIFNGGLTFNGGGQYGDATINNLPQGNKPIHTVEAWLNPSLLTAHAAWTITLGGAGGSDGTLSWVVNPAGSIQVNIRGTSAGYSATIPANTWTHVATTLDNNRQFRLYLNGVIVPGGPLVGTGVNFYNTTFTLGRDMNGESPFAGGMDEVRIWNVVLSASQIQSTMNTTLVGDEANLLAYYPMDEGSGSILLDASGHNNSIQLTGNPSWGAGNPLVIGQARFSQTITNLAPATTYHYQVVVTNSAGTVSGSDQTFTTGTYLPNITSQSVTSITSTNATLNTSINPNGVATTVYLQYGLTTNYEIGALTNSLAATNVVLPATGVATNLAAATTYHYRVIAANALGAATNSDLAFTTASIPPSVVTQPATSVGSTSGTLNAQVNPYGAATTVYFKYGLTASYGSFSSTNALAATNANLSVAIIVTNLTRGSVYHYQVVASNSLGTVFGSDLTFQPGDYPLAASLSPIGVTATNASIIGQVNPYGAITTVWFEWGRGDGYNQKTTAIVTNGSALISFTNQLTGLVAGMPYHYRMVASNGIASMRGVEVTFWAPAPALRLNGASAITNLANAPFTDPGGAATALPKMIAGGNGSGYVLRLDGSVAGWGRNDSGQVNIPSSATNLMAISANNYTCLGVRTNGTLVGWGYNNYGQAGVPGNINNAVAVRAGNIHGTALLADGTIVQWGNNSLLQLNQPPSITNAVAIAVGFFHNLALQANGVIRGWGYTTTGATSAPASATNVIALSAGNDYSLALRADGVVIGWGNNGSGQLNAPTDATNLVAISAGNAHVLGLRADGNIFAWGNNGSGQLNIPADATNIISIAAGDSHCYAVRADGTAFAWGDNAYGQLSMPSTLNDLSLPITVNGTVNTNVSGTYTLTYSATNSWGLSATNKRTVLVLTPTAPTAVTLPASAITTNSSLLSGQVGINNAVTTFYFQYGLTAAYGNTTPISTTNGLGLNFNGVNQYALITNLHGLARGNTPHTIEAWLNPSLLPNNREWVILLGNFGGGAHHWLLNHDGTTQLGVFGGSQVNPSLTANVWTHVAATFDGSTFSVYTNGVLVGSTAASFNLDGLPLSVGQSLNGESAYGGAMDSLAIWNTARTAAQIQSDMNIIAGTESGLIAYYPMEETSGLTIRDVSAHTNDLTKTSLTSTSGAPSLTNIYYQNITNLASGTLYHYRIVATNSAGSTPGADLTFTTLIPPATSPLVITGSILASGTNFQFTFANTPGATFTVFTTTNLSVPFTNWIPLTNIVENPAGQFQFTAPLETNPARFFRVQSP